ncbi:L,D-transpeptidase [Phenylobacterium sp.]|uniref:L,D-transpeptidase n=1 Tax=Phenylobacterium sp. TaxID=1871053 RepID=UPI002BC54EBA|nr:L,D-transpeptidase [Phenylobacterium sp.]HVI33768.1 L,D-transpeptidase [Phenylobacterium sp.]
MRFPSPAVAALLSLGLSAATSHARAETDPAIASVADRTDLTAMAAWVTARGDNNGLPFLILDKRSAEVSVFDADGRELSSSPALIGLATGDDSVAGIGDRPLAKIAAHERTTPAGRFRARFGPAEGQGETFWIDFSAAVSLHPVVTSNRAERRLERLTSPSPDDNRITFGCINVPQPFFDTVVRPTFAPDGGIAYVLPDSQPPEAVFPGLATRPELPAPEVARRLADIAPAAEGDTYAAAN